MRDSRLRELLPQTYLFVIGDVWKRTRPQRIVGGRLGREGHSSVQGLRPGVRLVAVYYRGGLAGGVRPKCLLRAAC